MLGPVPPLVMLGAVALASVAIAIVVAVVDRSVARREAARLAAARRDPLLVGRGHGPAFPHGVWSGSGIMRAWQLGPVGYERFWIRFDHVVDGGCWVVLRAGRPRLGFGMGAERQRLALTARGVEADRLPTLVRRALGGREIAIRPGLSPGRAWYRVRRTGAARAADRVLLGRADVAALVVPPGAEVRDRVRRSIEREIGGPFEESEILRDEPGLLRIVVSGPAWLFGAWTGPTPRLGVVASSGHAVWGQAGRGSGADVKATPDPEARPPEVVAPGAEPR